MKRLLAINLLVISGLAFADCDKSGKAKIRAPRTEGKKMPSEKTKSGVHYEVQKEGTGKCPTSGRMVTVHYTGWLDRDGQPGKEFDSSVRRGKPFTFTIGIGQVISGWDEGVMSMKVGEKRRLYIPARLGYAERGAGSVIPPNANLIFDVELLNVE